ncbi:helix-turn-helix domain-containing protein [Acetobacter sp. LMG 1636]|uniref:Helix-turn-helix domain-containing protein n=2 Tax=Acetobacter fallax TaxID=1737473 RepID=A0ABX0KE70_9PROT|nr:helix-turn-helix domain-containing protein [Acetobacter fallax]NHO37027.1 helix-turn-helix domain-containing protein [Acetobacter fallax]
MYKRVQSCTFRTPHDNAIPFMENRKTPHSFGYDQDPFQIHDIIGHEGLRDFLDIESLEVRSRPVNWRVRRHSHASMFQLFLLSTGGCTVELDGVSHELASPGFVWIPARHVHSLAYHPRTRGYVITLGHGHVFTFRMRCPEAAPLFAASLAGDTDLSEFDRLITFARYQPAMPDQATGTVTEALAQLILATIFRLLRSANTPVPSRRDAELVKRFHALVERDFASHAPVSAYLDVLRTTERTLRRACKRMGQPSPHEIIQSRIAAESRRLLLFSGMSAADIADRLGFSDPAYFSRWFRAREGTTIRAFRDERDTK